MFLNLPARGTFVEPSSKFTLFYILLSALLAVISVNSLLTFFSLMTILISLRWVWRANEPPILAYIVFYHWVQISMKILHANLLGVDIQDIASSNSSDQAIYLSLLGLLFLSFGVFLVVRTLKPVDLGQIIDLSNRYSLTKLLKIYIAFFFIAIFLKGVMFAIPGLTQAIVGILNFKIVLIYFIFLVSVIQKQYKILIWMVIIETIFGLTGFFSTFKLPYILLFLAYFTINYRVSFRVIKFSIPLIMLVMIMGLTWTAIKTDYRYAINKGENTQTVNVDTSEQINILLEHIGRVDLGVLALATEDLAYRLAYVDFFGQVIDYVPRNRDYEYGQLWFDAITHVFQPRILFPNKPVLDDSSRTTKYTGYRYAGLDEGASIGIGYFAESYIDFGSCFMYFPLFLMGVFYGFIYRYLVRNVKNPILAYAMIVAILLGAALFETRNDKLFGGVLSAFVILLIMKRLFMTRLFSSTRFFKKRIL